MPRNLKDFAGKDPIFIDANIFLHHAFDSDAMSVEFLVGVESRSFKAFTSSLVLEEVFFKLVVQSASNLLNKVTLPGIKGLLRDSKKRALLLTPVLGYRNYVDLLKESGLSVMDLKGSDILKAMQMVSAHGLLTADAAHLAVMERNAILNLASADSDFYVVPGITVWSPV